MKPVSKLALAAALIIAPTGIAISPAVAQEEEAAPPAVGPGGEVAVEYNPENLSDAVRDAIAPAQEARTEGDTAGALSQVQAAIALIQNDDDRYLLGSELIQVAVAMQSAGATDEQTRPLLVQGAQLSLDSGRTAIARRATLYKLVGDSARQAGDHAAAVAAYENALRYSPNDPAASILLADAYFESGNAQAGLQAADRAIQMQTDSGNPVDPTWISVGLNGAYEANNTEGVARYTAMLIRANGADSANISNALRAYQAIGGFDEDEQATLDLYRLMRAAGALNQSGAAQQYVLFAAMRGLPGEAQAVQNEALAASVITSAQARPAPAELTAAIAADRAGLEESATSARAAATGQGALNTADAYAGYGQYDQAIELYRLAVQKGGIDAGTANLRLGAALAAAGRADEARTAFQAVTGQRAGLAQLWLAWLDHRAGGAAAPAPAAAQPQQPAPGGS